MVWLLLGISLLLMIICGLFVAAEFSFVSVDRATIDQQAQDGDQRAAGTQKALRTLSTQLSGAQIGITITNLAIGFLAQPAIGELVESPLEAAGLAEGNIGWVSYLIAVSLSTLLTMLIGELIPKQFAISLPLETAKATQAFMRGFTKMMALPIRWLNGTANGFLRMIGIEPQEELRSARSPIELRSIVLRSAKEGSLQGDTATLVARSIAFGDRTAADVRTPRVRVQFLDARDTAADLIEAVRQTGHSRFPVIDKHPDSIVGLVHVKHAVAVPVERRKSTKLEELVVPALIVPDSIELDPLLVELRRQGLQMAIVADEYGGTDGIVTLEDLVEELVGDIADEHDRVSQSTRRRGENRWSISAMLRPDEIIEQTGIVLPEDEDYETVAGLIVKELGRVAQKGDVVTIRIESNEDDEPAEEIRLKVERMEGRRIDRVLIERVDSQ